MVTRSNGHVRVSSTDLLIAMLSSDLRGSGSEEGCASRSREHVDPAASTPLPAMSETEDPEERSR